MSTALIVQLPRCSNVAGAHGVTCQQCLPAVAGEQMSHANKARAILLESMDQGLHAFEVGDASVEGIKCVAATQHDY